MHRVGHDTRNRSVALQQLQGQQNQVVEVHLPDSDKSAGWRRPMYAQGAGEEYKEVGYRGLMGVEVCVGGGANCSKNEDQQAHAVSSTG